MPYRIESNTVGHVTRDSLEAAARTISKMRDSGVDDIRLFDEARHEVDPDEVTRAWLASAARSRHQ